MRIGDLMIILGICMIIGVVIVQWLIHDKPKTEQKPIGKIIEIREVEGNYEVTFKVTDACYLQELEDKGVIISYGRKIDLEKGKEEGGEK